MSIPPPSDTGGITKQGLPPMHARDRALFLLLFIVLICVGVVWQGLRS
jgi:hypothetical protein